MANTLNGINLAAIAQSVLDNLSAQHTPVSAFTTDFSSEIADQGESITTRIATAVSAGDASSGYSATDVTSSAKTVTLNQHKHFTMAFTDLEIAKGGMNMLERTFVRPATHAVINSMVDALMALVVNSEFANKATVTSSNFGADDVATLAGDLTTLNVPKDERALIIKPAYYASLAQDNAIQASYASTLDDSIRNHSVPRVHGFNVYEYSDIPSNSENLEGFACGPEALLIAARQPAIPQNWSGAVESVTDPDSGLTIQLRSWYEGKDGKQMITATTIFGVLVGSNSLKRIVSA
tara:strand:- start:2448 stop:3329 length:882 start_codon:yes stop_codon:yes gene_type:complete